MSCKLRHLGASAKLGVVTDVTLRELAAHGASIATLSLPDARRVTTVAPVSATLRKLVASHRCGVDDAGLATAARIKTLDVAGNGAIRTVAPCAGSLRKLKVGYGCGIDDAGLATATLIADLDAGFDKAVRTVVPSLRRFANSTRRLAAWMMQGSLHRRVFEC